jgi:hypothetical protein
MSKLLLFCLIFFTSRLFAQRVGEDDLDIAKLLLPVDSSNIFISPDHYTWCGSVVKGEDGNYYMFYARWPHGPRVADDDSLNRIFNGFRGWQKYSEIAIAVSSNPTGPYRHLKTILKGEFDQDRWDRYTYHNPQVNFFDGRYYLYFISNSFTDNMHFTRSLGREQLHWYKYNCTQRIGVATSSSIAGFLDGSFQKKPEHLVMPDSIRTFEVAVNPSVTKGPDGRFYMMYKSRKPDLGHMTFWMAVAPTPEGPFTHFSEVFTGADMACEDPYLWYDKKRRRFYAVAKYFSRTGNLVPEFGALALLSSVDGKKWEAARHPLVSLKKIRFKNGEEVRLAHLERPFILFDGKGRMQALFAAASVKDPFRNQTNQVDPSENTFNVHIPLNRNLKK